MHSDFNNKMLMLFAFTSAIAGFLTVSWVAPLFLAILFKLIIRTRIVYRVMKEFEKINWNSVFFRLKHDLIIEIIGSLIWMYAAYILGWSISKI